MFWHHRRPSPALVISIIALVIAVGGTAWAAIPSTGGVIYACYANIGGFLRVIDPATGQHCIGRVETPLSFNVTGPQGQPGATGATGAQGTAGATGPTGPASTLGSAYVDDYLTSSELVSTDSPVAFDSIQATSDMTVTASGAAFTAATNGEYLVSVNLPGPYTTWYFAVDGDVIGPQVLAFARTIHLDAGDELSIVNTGEPVTVSAGAEITLVRIG